MTAARLRAVAGAILRPMAVVPVLAVVTACAAGPVSPLPTHAASRPGVAPAGIAAAATTASVTVAPPTAATTTRPPNPPAGPRTTTVIRTYTVRPPTSEPTSPGPCRGVEQYDLDLQENELSLIRSMCFRAGSILRLQGIGPGLVTSEPDTVASQSYEGGVVDIRFIRPGTATVTIPQDDQVHTITVVVIS